MAALKDRDPEKKSQGQGERVGERGGRVEGGMAGWRMARARSGYSSKPCPLAGNGWSPQYTALCISIKANGMKQNPITEEQTGGLSAA